MSLPVPSTSRTPLTKNEQEMELFDMPLIALTNKCHGDLRQLLFAFFSFLYRRTDFYIVHDESSTSKNSMGFKQGDAEKLLLAAFRQFPLRKIPKTTSSNPSPTTTNSKPSNITSSPKSIGTSNTTTQKPDDNSKNSTPDDHVVDNPPKEEKNVSNSSSNNTIERSKETTKQPETTKDNAAVSDSKEESKPKSSSSLAVNTAVRYTEEGKQIPVGNGGTTKLYTWTQTLDECTVILNKKIPVRGKDLHVTIQSNSISVQLKKGVTLPNSITDTTTAVEDDPTILLEGKLVESILPNESSWTIEDGIIILVLFKRTKTFWKTIIEGDDEIDATLVDSRRNIDTYDAATQAQIRKIIFDQNQYHKGLPTSDEIIGQKVPIPPLPPGVEYIDQNTLDTAAAASKTSTSKPSSTTYTSS